MKRLNNIDLLKFICAVLVVFLHMGTPYQQYILPLTRCAVPCFLIISGYFIFNADDAKFQARLKKNIRKIFRVLVWSTLLFAVVKFMFAFKQHDFSFLSLKALVKFVVLNENPFGFHLWYIGAYLYTLLIVLFLERRGWLKCLYWAAPILLMTDLCFGKYSLVLWNMEIPFICVRNFLCVGIPYFAVGMFIKKWRGTLLGIRYLPLLTFGGGDFVFVNIVVRERAACELGLNATRDHYASSTFLAVSLFLFFLSARQVGQNVLSDLGEKDSLYIYILHPLFIMFFRTVNNRMPALWQDTYLYLSPIIILIATILLSKTLRILHIIK